MDSIYGLARKRAEDARNVFMHLIMETEGCLQLLTGEIGGVSRQNLQGMVGAYLHALGGMWRMAGNVAHFAGCWVDISELLRVYTYEPWQYDFHVREGLFSFASQVARHPASYEATVHLFASSSAAIVADIARGYTIERAEARLLDKVAHYLSRYFEDFSRFYHGNQFLEFEMVFGRLEQHPNAGVQRLVGDAREVLRNKR